MSDDILDRRKRNITEDIFDEPFSRFIRGRSMYMRAGRPVEQITEKVI